MTAPEPAAKGGENAPGQPTAKSTADPAPFAAHHAMRERLKAGLRQGSIALIDVGSSKVACLIAEIDPAQRGASEGRDGGASGGYGALRIVGAGQNRSRGVRLGEIVDMDEADRAIRAAVTQAERDSGRRVFHAIATLTGAYPRSHALNAEVEISGGRVARPDLAKAVLGCQPPPARGGFGAGRDVLHATPVNWSVDAQQSVADPIGFSGRRLGVDLHVLTVADNAIQNLAHCLARADLELAGVASTSYVSGLSSLVEEELEDGAACVDMGGGATTVSMFLRGKLMFADLVRMGGEHVTLDIVRGLGLGQADAERLKTLEGSAIALDGAARDPLDLGSGYFGGGARPTRSDLSAVIRPRVEETLELARDRLEQAGFAYLPARRIVLTGGAAQLPGAVETAQRVFGRQARLGRPMRISGLPPTFSGPAFSGVAGLAAYALRVGEEAWDIVEPKPETPTKGPLSGVFRWFRDTW